MKLCCCLVDPGFHEISGETMGETPDGAKLKAGTAAVRKTLEKGVKDNSTYLF